MGWDVYRFSANKCVLCYTPFFKSLWLKYKVKIHLGKGRQQKETVKGEKNYPKAIYNSRIFSEQGKQF